MRYIKVLGKDGSIISAEALQDPVFVNYQTINKIILRCPFVKAQGILSADGSQIYQLKDFPQLPGEYLVAEEISQTDYEDIIQELEIPESVQDDEYTEETEEIVNNIMTAAEMREKIIDLMQQVEFLGDCLVEMSEVIYD